MLKLVADENIPGIEAMLGSGWEVVRRPGRSLCTDDLVGADALWVRSITHVNEALLHKASALKMLGTATIGVDHLDQDYLQSRQLPFFSAPGCNADAVVDYVLACLYSLLAEQGRTLDELTVGIVGVGNVGGRLHGRLRAAGVATVLNDPPRAARGDAGFVPLSELLVCADIVCLHTPLVESGPWPTRHLFSESELAGLKPDALLLNAGRGAVIDQAALLACVKERRDLSLILDVWPQEPAVSPALAACVNVASAHIAGYSLEGKLRGTHMLSQRLATLFEQPGPEALDVYLPPAAVPKVWVESAQLDISRLMALLYDPWRDDRAFRKILHQSDQPACFDQLRKEYPVRREFSALQVCGVQDEQQAHRLSALGFGLSD